MIDHQSKHKELIVHQSTHKEFTVDQSKHKKFTKFDQSKHEEFTMEDIYMFTATRELTLSLAAPLLDLDMQV